MKKHISAICALAVIVVLSSGSVYAAGPKTNETAEIAWPAQEITGLFGAAGGDANLWYSSWIDLNPPMDFRNGDKLIIQLQGNPGTRVSVRLLTVGAAYDSQFGIVGGIRQVPEGGVITVDLNKDYKHICQISVHSGHQIFKRPLGDNNGTADISSVMFVRGR